MNGCKFFQCESCKKVIPVGRQNIVKAALTNYGPKSEKKLIYNIYHILICDLCKGSDIRSQNPTKE